MKASETDTGTLRKQKERTAMLSYLPLAQKVIIIGETRFELATSASRTQRSSQAELLPGQRIYDLRFSICECDFADVAAKS
jgi:hypothetical protein